MLQVVIPAGARVLAAVLSAAALAVGVALASGTGQPAASPADLIVTNGRVFTGADGPVPEAVAVRGSRIVMVGSGAAVTALRGAATTVVDAGGATVVPGFNDSTCTSSAALRA